MADIRFNKSQFKAGSQRREQTSAPAKKPAQLDDNLVDMVSERLSKKYDRECLSVKELAHELGIAEKMARKYLHNGDIRYRKNGKAYIISVVYVAKFILGEDSQPVHEN